MCDEGKSEVYGQAAYPDSEDAIDNLRSAAGESGGSPKIQLNAHKWDEVFTLLSAATASDRAAEETLRLNLYRQIKDDLIRLADEIDDLREDLQKLEGGDND